MQWEGVHALVLGAKRGDEQSWLELHALVRPYLLRLAHRYLGPDCPGESASDLLQSTWMHACQGIDAFRGGCNDAETGALFRAWLSRTLKNVRSNDRRFAQAARRQTSLPSRALHPAGDSTSLTLGIDPADDQSTPSANVRARERQLLIQQALNDLTDSKDQAIIRLRFFEELSLAQIAKRLAMSYDDVRERFHRSLRCLEPKLKGLQ